MLTLAYHPPSTYRWELYRAEDQLSLFTHTNASFGGLPRLCANGGKLVSEGYEQYFTNGPVMNAQGYFFYKSPSGAESGEVQLHTYSSASIPPSSTPIEEDEQRRSFWTEPADDTHLLQSWINGHHFYIQEYNTLQSTFSMVDSFATTMVRHLNRTCCADVAQTARPTADGSKIVYLLRYIPATVDGTYKWASFIWSKSSRKFTKAVEEVALPMDTRVQADDEGNLLYALPDDAGNRWSWTIFRQKAGVPTAEQIGTMQQQSPAYVNVNEVREFFGKVYVSASMPSSASKGARAYLLRVN